MVIEDFLVFSVAVKLGDVKIGFPVLEVSHVIKCKYKPCAGIHRAAVIYGKGLVKRFWPGIM